MNWRIKRLRERQAALVKQSESILEAAAKDSDRELTEAEKKSIEDNRAELEAVAARIKREEELAQFSAAAGVVPVDGPAAGTGGQVLGNPRPAFAEDPQCGFRTPREFMMAVMANADRPAREAADERLRFLATAGSDEQGSYSDPYGGFLVPIGFSPNMLQVAAEADPIGPRVQQVPMTAPTVAIPARTDKNHTTSVSGGLVFTRRAETQTQAASRMEMEKVVISAYSLFGLAYATEEILNDSPISFAALLEAGFRDQLGAHLVNERLNGTGVGEFEGIMNAACLVTADADDNQTADTITGTNIVAMRARCWGYSQAVWLANHDCLPQLIKVNLANASGYPISIYHPSLKEGEPDMLLGRPIVYTEYCKTIGDVGDIVLGNWSQYLEGTYERLQSAESIHVRFVNHERTFKFWLRNGARCWWRSALTPKNSTATLSPFVVLAAR